ncbi:MAG: transglycosylase domain-containing protein [Desulfomonile tiedjei]|nr:transglycosylase domain-containing protein [Desulfomonile tiedjei]
MALNPKKVWTVLKRTVQVLLVGLAAYALVLAGVVLWTFEAKLKRWPIYLYSAPLTIVVGDQISQTGLFDRLKRLGYAGSSDPVPEPGYWNRSLGEIAVFLKPVPFRAEGTVTGPISFGLDFDRIRSIRLLRSLQEVERIAIESELIQIIPAEGDEPEMCCPAQLDKIPQLLVDAIVLTEDGRFFSHSGIDVYSIVRAFRMNLKAGRYVEGGSTISQQLIRMSVLSAEKTLARKVNEVVMALLTEVLYNKRTILEAYLNRVYLGHAGPFPVRGVAEAARHFFGKDLAELNAAECALIAATIKAPNVINPQRNSERARGRRNMVLGLLFKEGKISRESYDEAVSAPVRMSRNTPVPVRAPAFVELVKDSLPADIPGKDLNALQQHVLTSLDPLLQHDGEMALRAFGKAGTQAYLILADPRSGEIGGLITPSGASRWSGDGGDLVSLLPFVTVPALVPEKQQPPPYTLNSQLIVKGSPDKTITLRHAFAGEKALLAERILGSIGPERMAAALREFGFPAEWNKDRGITLKPVTPMAMAHSYCVLATLGNAGTLRPGVRVGGMATAQSQDGPKAISVSPAGMFMVNHLMKGIGPASLRTDPTDRSSMQPSVFTAHDSSGIWSVAYRDDAVLLLRLQGTSFNDRKVERTLRRLLSGVAHASETAPRSPDGLVFRKICADSGFLGTSICPRVIREPFFKGTQPSEWCPLRHDPGPAGRAAGK